jgi:hypothetical protein
MTTTHTEPAASADSAGTPWFLRGGFAPVSEERTVFDLEVDGALPPAMASG